MRYNDQSWVAKCLFNVGNGPEKVTVDENNSEIVAECTHLKMGEWLLKVFYEQVSDFNVQIEKSMYLNFSNSLAVY